MTANPQSDLDKAVAEAKERLTALAEFAEEMAKMLTGTVQGREHEIAAKGYRLVLAELSRLEGEKERLQEAVDPLYCSICGSCGSCGSDGCGCEHKCKYAAAHPDVVAETERLEAALTEARREVSELRGVLEWIANHRNDGLTDGSAATRACLDEIVNLAAAALASQPNGGGDA